MGSPLTVILVKFLCSCVLRGSCSSFVLGFAFGVVPLCYYVVISTAESIGWKDLSPKMA